MLDSSTHLINLSCQLILSINLSCQPILHTRVFTRGDKSRGELAKELARKSEATREILRRYTSERLPEADLQRVLDSISDNQAYLAFNVDPVQRALDILTSSFNPKKPQVTLSSNLLRTPFPFEFAFQ